MPLCQRLPSRLLTVPGTQDPDDIGVSPPLAILDHAQVLREMMVVYESSLLGDEQDEELQAGFRDILDKMVDPALEMTLTQAEEKKRQRPGWDKAVFVLNTLAYLQGVLEPFSFTTEKRGVVQGLMDAKVLQLIEEHVSLLIPIGVTLFGTSTRPAVRSRGTGARVGNDVHVLGC